MLLAALTILVRSAGLVVQVPLAGDAGILQAVGPAADLAGAISELAVTNWPFTEGYVKDGKPAGELASIWDP